MSLEFSSRKSFEGINEQRDTRDDYLERLIRKRNEQMEFGRFGMEGLWKEYDEGISERRNSRDDYLKRLIRKRNEQMEFGRFGMEGLGKEIDEGIYGVYPQTTQDRPLTDTLEEELQRMAHQSKEKIKQELKLIDEEIEKLFFDCCDAYVANNISKKKEFYDKIFFWECVRKSVNFGIPLSVAKSLGEHHRHADLADDDIERYDTEVLRRLETKYEKMLEEHFDSSFKPHQASNEMVDSLREDIDQKAERIEDSRTEKEVSEPKVDSHQDVEKQSSTTEQSYSSEKDNEVNTNIKQLNDEIKKMKEENPGLLDNPLFSYYLMTAEEKINQVDVNYETILTYLKMAKDLVNDYKEKTRLVENMEAEIIQEHDDIKDNTDRKEQTNIVEEIANQRSEYESVKKEYEEEKEKILRAKHFTDKQKKEMIEALYSELDKYTEENPELSGRHM